MPAQSQGSVHQDGAGRAERGREQFHDAVEHDGYMERVDPLARGPDAVLDVTGAVLTVWPAVCLGWCPPPVVPHAPPFLHAVTVSP
ncbi:hypothetical protein GCM10026982_40750 [Nocardiopsis aegyptia]